MGVWLLGGRGLRAVGVIGAGWRALGNGLGGGRGRVGMVGAWQSGGLRIVGGLCALRLGVLGLL